MSIGSLHELEFEARKKKQTMDLFRKREQQERMELGINTPETTSIVDGAPMSQSPRATQDHQELGGLEYDDHAAAVEPHCHVPDQRDHEKHAAERASNTTSHLDNTAAQPIEHHRMHIATSDSDAVAEHQLPIVSAACEPLANVRPPQASAQKAPSNKPSSATTTSTLVVPASVLNSSVVELLGLPLSNIPDDNAEKEQLVSSLKKLMESSKVYGHCE
jgi:hypothetical protein